MGRSRPPSEPRPAGQLEERLEQQIGYLRRSAEMYDAGFWDEAARLASSIAILVHDGRYKSLLSLLGVREQLSFVDTTLHRQTIDARQALLLEQAREATGEPSLVIASRRPEAGLVSALLGRVTPSGAVGGAGAGRG